MWVSLTRSGISRLLTAFHRRMMIPGVDRAEKLVQLFFSIVSIYKVLLVVEGGWTCRLSIRMECDTMPCHNYSLLINDHVFCSMASLFTKWLLCIAYMLRIPINPLIETPSVSCQNKPIYYLRLQPTAFTPRPPLD